MIRYTLNYYAKVYDCPHAQCELRGEFSTANNGGWKKKKKKENSPDDEKYLAGANVDRADDYYVASIQSESMATTTLSAHA